MKVAVTGANGFVGRAVLTRLAQAGIEAIPLVRRASGLGGERIIGDLADGNVCAADLADASTIVHLAARTHVMNETTGDPLAEYRRTNVDGTIRLLKAANEAHIERFVFMSSIKAVGEWSKPGDPLQPKDLPRPEDAYGRSKLEAEEYVASFCKQHALRFKIIRPPLVHGIGVKGNLARLEALINSGIPLPLGSINNARSFVGVHNLADAVVAASASDKGDGAVLHIADLVVSTPDLVRLICRATGRPVRLLPFPPPLLRSITRLAGLGSVGERLIGSLELSTESSFQKLGWRPASNGEDALQESFGLRA